MSSQADPNRRQVAGYTAGDDLVWQDQSMRSPDAHND